MRSHENEAGYTLVELGVTMLLTLLVGSLMFATYLALVQGVERWRKRIVLENETHLVFQRLMADLMYAEQLLFEAEGTWRIVLGPERQVHYHLTDSVLLRNGLPMHEAGVAVANLQLVPSRPETRYAPLPRDNVPETAQHTLQVEVHLTLQNPHRHLSLTGTTTLRRSGRWNVPR